MTRQSPLLAILQLFETDRLTWTVEDISNTLGMSLRTAYRHVRELTLGGFLDPISGAGYVLGPAFIRYDRVIRQSDPLIGLADPPMARLLQRTTQEAAVILCRRFKDCVMSVHLIEGDAPHIPASYERGAAMPLFRGAPAKVILAFLPDRMLRGLYLRQEQQNALGDSGVTSWVELKAQLRDIRKTGIAVTDSEVGPGRMGIAAPIFRAREVLASISLVLAAPADANDPRVLRFASQVQAAASEISNLLIEDTEAV